MASWDNTPPVSKTIAGITFSNTGPDAAVLPAARNTISVKTRAAVNGLPVTSLFGVQYDGYTLEEGDAVLVICAATPEASGVYVAAAAVAPSVRIASLNTAAELEAGIRVDITAGNLAGISYWLRPAAPITLGVTPLYFDRGGVAIAL
jgi:hypothetical protein